MDSEAVPTLCEGDCLQPYSLGSATFDQLEGKPIWERLLAVQPQTSSRAGHRNSVMTGLQELSILRSECYPMATPIWGIPRLTSTYSACVSDSQSHCLRTLQASYLYEVAAF